MKSDFNLNLLFWFQYTLFWFEMFVLVGCANTVRLLGLVSPQLCIAAPPAPPGNAQSSVNNYNRSLYIIYLLGRGKYSHFLTSKTISWLHWTDGIGCTVDNPQLWRLYLPQTEANLILTSLHRHSAVFLFNQDEIIKKFAFKFNKIFLKPNSKLMQVNNIRSSLYKYPHQIWCLLHFEQKICKFYNFSNFGIFHKKMTCDRLIWILSEFLCLQQTSAVPSFEQTENNK